MSNARGACRPQCRERGQASSLRHQARLSSTGPATDSGCSETVLCYHERIRTDARRDIAAGAAIRHVRIHLFEISGVALDENG